jgi:hypothetical protein
VVLRWGEIASRVQVVLAWEVLAWEVLVGLLVGGVVLAWEELGAEAQMALGVVVAGGFWFPRQP